MKKLRKLLVVCLIVVLSLSFAACGGSSEPAQSNTGGDDAAKMDYKIAIIPMSLNDPYQVMMANAAKLRCDELGIEGVIQAPGSGSMSDVAGQIELIENVVASGTYDAIVCAPIAVDGIITGIKIAQDAGIKMVVMDGKVDMSVLEDDGYKVVPFVGTDNLAAATATGKWITEHYPEGTKMAMINGPEGHDNGINRRDGLLKGMNGWTDVVAQQSTQWAVDDSYVATQNIITANPDIKLIWCACDALGVGTIRALEEAGKADSIDVIAYDGTVQGLELVLDGSEVANTAQFPDVMGSTAIDLAIKELKGEPAELVTDSGYEVVTADTAQKFIDRLKKYL